MSHVWKLSTRQIRKQITFASSGIFFAVALFFNIPASAQACNFLVPDQQGNPIQGPSFETIDDGFTRGLLECGNESHRLMIMTIDVDVTQQHIGVRDDPLFSSKVVGELKRVDDITISNNTQVHILGRTNQSPLIGVQRGFVHFATMCDEDDIQAPLDCSWGTSRIKFRSTTIDTDNDEIVDRSYHELSVYNASGRLHMVSFWTPYRDQLAGTTRDWVSALKAFGLNVAQNAG